MTLTNILMIIAIFCGPIAAVRIQKIIERLTQKKIAKENIFKTLMSTRGLSISLPHVQALNLIDLEFFGKNQKDVKVVEAWKLYRAHLYDPPRDTQSSHYATDLNAWSKKRNELLADLLYEMAENLSYHFDKVLLKTGSYTPSSYEDAELLQITLRSYLYSLVDGKGSLPVNIVSADNQPAEKAEDPPK